MEVVAFARAGVEDVGDLVTARLGEILHGGAFRQVLANEPVGVFVRAAFPGVVRGSEVEENVGQAFDLFVGMELGSVVDGDGAEQMWALSDDLQEASVDSRAVASSEFGDQNAAGKALNEGEDAVLGGRADDGVDFPVAELVALIHRDRAFGDVAFAW